MPKTAQQNPYHFAPGKEPDWDIPKVYDVLVELYNRYHGTDYQAVVTRKEAKASGNQ